MEKCACSEAYTRSLPIRREGSPSRRESAPAARSRAIFRAMAFATPPPLVNTPKARGPNPIRSFIQRISRISRCVAAGAAFQASTDWFKKAAGSSANAATGSGAGLNRPKILGWDICIEWRKILRRHSSSTRSGLMPFSGSAPANSRSRSAIEAPLYVLRAPP